jgi:hypothetical protein
MISTLFVFGFTLLLCWGMEATFPTGTKGIKRY